MYNMMTMVNTALWYYRKAVKSKSKNSRNKKNFFFFFFLLMKCWELYEILNVSWTYCGNHFTIYVNQTSMLYALGLYGDTCQSSLVQSLSCVQLFLTPWTAACQASLSIANSRSSLKLMSIESVMPSNHLILCHPLLLLPPIPPSIRVFSESQFFASGGQSIGVSASASVLPMDTQDWFPLGWTGWISLQSQGLSRVFSNTTVQKHQFFGAQLSLQSNSHIHTWLMENP